MNHKDAYRTASLIKQMCYVRHRGANGLDINRIGDYYQIRILFPIMDMIWFGKEIHIHIGLNRKQLWIG